MMGNPFDKFDQPAAGGNPFDKFDSQPRSAKKDDPSSLTSLGAGMGKGFGSTILTLQQYMGKALTGADDLVSDRRPTISGLIAGKAPERSVVGKAGQWLIDDAVNGKRNLASEVDPYEKAHPVATGIGDVGGGIAATWPVGGLLGKGISAAAELPQLARIAPQLAKLAKAAETSGLKTGAPLAADATLAARLGDLGIRAGGGALTGGTSAALATPDHVERGAVLGAVLPPSLIGAAKLARYGAGAAKSVVQPFTEAGQDAIAAKIIQKFGAGGPMAVDAAELVPGSLPTLAEATGNAGIAGLQRAARDLRPNAFAEREAGNAAARTAAFDKVAGDPAKLDFFKASRSTAANELYDRALSVNPADNMSPYLKGQITQLLKRPSISDAMKTAQQWALERGEKPSANGSLTGLHDVKTALDDQIASAVRDNQGGQVKALTATRDKLLQVMEKLSPDYGEARATYAAMSQPINAMEALQGLRLTDARGNITLAKVKNGVEGLERLQAASGVNAAKSLQPEQMDALRAIQADLLRQDLLNKGRSIGSNTFQNIATDNILTSLLPGRLGEAVKGKAGGLLGQAGKLAYSGPNEAIRNRLTDMMLTPDLVQAVLARQQAISAPTALERLLQLPGVGQSVVRIGPVASDR
jgi:hypothetical protein